MSRATPRPPGGRNWWPWLPAVIVLAAALANVRLIRLATDGGDGPVEVDAPPAAP